MSDDPHSTAIEQLTALGLSTYAARTLVALVGLGDGTAQDVSEVSDVPRTRVYDAVSELKERGLVDVQHSEPRRFTSVSSETAGRLFDREYRDRVNTLRTALDEVSVAESSAEQRGVWTVTGTEAIDDRIQEFLAEATEEVVYMSVGHLLAGETIEHLSQAADRGIDVRLAEMSGPVETDLREAVPEATWFESLWDWSATPAGRLLMVDQTRTLVSVSSSPAATESGVTETAIWGSGEHNSLVVVLRALFTWQLDGNRG